MLSVSWPSMIAKRSSMVSQCSMTLSCTASLRAPGAATSAISSMASYFLSAASTAAASARSLDPGHVAGRPAIVEETVHRMGEGAIGHMEIAELGLELIPARDQRHLTFCRQLVAIVGARDWLGSVGRPGLNGMLNPDPSGFFAAGSTTPMNAAVLVPTPAIGGVPGTSST